MHKEFLWYTSMVRLLVNHFLNITKILQQLDHVSFVLSIPFSRHSDAAIKLASECASMGTAKFEVETDASP